MLRTLLDIFVIWPMPAVWLLLLGLLLVRLRAGGFVMAVAAVLLLVGAMPVTGQVMLRGLERGAPQYDAGSTDVTRLDAIVVPLAGAFEDAAGNWWPLAGSITRTVRGQQLQAATGLPLMVVGGAPFPGQTVPEAVALQRLVRFDADVAIESTARDSFETAQVVAVHFVERGVAQPRVLLVTSRSHIWRMSASLRRFGVDVVVASPRGFSDPRLVRTAWLDLVPSTRGLGNVRVAWREYVGIGWYLMSGRIRLRDL